MRMSELSSAIHISVSQLKSMSNCPRLHWFQKVGQVPSTKEKKGAERGKQLHSFVETYLTTPICEELLPNGLYEFMEKSEFGVNDPNTRHGIRSADSNPTLLRLRKVAHDPNSNVKVLVEQQFNMSPVFVGFVDLIVLDRRSGDLKVTIFDHKFISDKRSMLTPESARTDYQTIIYSKALLTYYNLDRISFQYDYYGTKYKWYESVRVEYTKSEIEALWANILGDVRLTLDNYKVPSADLAIPNYTSCGMYGGCDYKEHCFK